MNSLLYTIKRYIPAPVFAALQPVYHFSLAVIGALVYFLPSRRITVIGVTGTKGKSTTLEVLNAIFEKDGRKTALAGTIRFKVGNESKPNKEKMTLPGRFFIQRFLSRAVKSGCDIALLELTSEGAKQYRHRFIALDALIFTNLTPEHIESHGSFENYLAAKLSIARELAYSPKKNKAIVANADSEYGERFLKTKVENQIPYSVRDVSAYTISENHIDFTYNGQPMHVPLRGRFNLENVLGAVKCAEHFGVSLTTIAAALAELKPIPGRVELINCGQPFDVVVDYAHTVESLIELYETFAHTRRICVMGATGGGRDKWKRPKMGKTAEQYCDEIILTNEDPYDEDPEQIMRDIKDGMERAEPEIIMDRREAIREGLARAKEGDAVLVTGKGTDPYIMGPNGTRTPWSDAAVAKEELRELGFECE